MTDVLKWLLLAVVILLGGTYFAYGQYKPSPQDVAACGEDVRRFCPVHDGMAIISCLQNHRQSLSKACASLLLDRGG